MYKLVQESGAGVFGTEMIFLSLGLGIAGFVARSVIQLVVTAWAVFVQSALGALFPASR